MVGQTGIWELCELGMTTDWKGADRFGVCDFSRLLGLSC